MLGINENLLVCSVLRWIFLYIQIAYKGHVKDSDTMLLIFNNYLKRIVHCKKKKKI